MTMQQNWARRHDFVTLDTEEIAAMLRPVSSRRSIKSIELLKAGNCNTNYKITLSGLSDAFVLRIYVRDQTACQKDLDIYTLVGARVPVPEMLYAAPTPAAHTYAYAVTRWVEGTLFSDILAAGNSSLIAPCADAIGRTLAHIGSYTFAQAGFFGPGLTIAEPFAEGSATYLTVFEQLLLQGSARQRLGEELTERLWQFVQDNTRYLEATAGVADLVHSDFKGFNILVRQTDNAWHVAAVLDWEFAFASTPLIDIGNMLRYDHIHPREFEVQFIRGYLEQGGTLPSGWKKTAKLLDLLSLCEFLHSPMANSALITEVTELILGTLERWHEFSRE